MRRLPQVIWLLSFLLPLGGASARAQDHAHAVDYQRGSLSPAAWEPGELERHAQAHVHEGAVEAEHAMVAAALGSPAVHAGVRALELGGSAADAVLTTALTNLALLAGQAASYAGFMNLVYYEAETGRVYSMNAGWNTVRGETDPLSIPTYESGEPSGRTALVPGFMAGVQATHDRFGTLPFEALFEPAVYFADEGFAVPGDLAWKVQLNQGVLDRTPEARRIFQRPDGAWVEAGDTLRQPELAATLRRVAEEGAGYMYTGAWAEDLVAAVRREGGHMSLGDLADYDVVWSDPAHTTYRGYDLYGLGPPNMGGLNLMEAFNLLELADPASLGPTTESAESLYRLLRVARVADVMGTYYAMPGVAPELRARYLPGVDTSRAARLTKGHARRLWEAMQDPAWRTMLEEDAALRDSTGSDGHSDAVVAVDERGNVAALLYTTNTAFWGRTGLFVGGVSIPDPAASQQRLVAAVGPGARMPEATPPLIVLASCASGFGPAAGPAESGIVETEPSPDTVRHTIIINGHRKGERRMWQEDLDTWRYEYDGNPYDSYHFPRSERLVLDKGGFPVRIEIDGQRNPQDAWEERFEMVDGRARWSALARSRLGPQWDRTLDSGEVAVDGAAYYAAIHPVHDPGILARLLLRQDEGQLPLLPAGTARLEPLGERAVGALGESRRVRLHGIHGLDLRPTYVWLDEDGATFADEWSVRSGWEEEFPELRAAMEEALAQHHRGLAEGLAPAAREGPLVLRDARLFDPRAGKTGVGTTIIIEGNRISAVGPDSSLDVPPNAEVLDAGGRAVLPGLWDMHTHHGISETYLELMAPLYLAGGVTTARDLGSPTEPMLSLRKRIGAREAIGPRLLLAGWIEGAGGRPTGPLVGNASEALAVVDRFAELGYLQIKIYHNLAPEFVPVVIERAKQHGMRISGHIPLKMTTRDAVELGYDEIQHLSDLVMLLAPDALAALASGQTPERLDAFYSAMAGLEVDSHPVEELIQLLASHGVAVDPTLAVMDSWDLGPRPWVERVTDRFPSQASRRIIDLYLFNLWPVHSLWEEIFGNMIEIIAAMHGAGVPILPGSDMEIAGFSLHRELELYVEAGIPAPDVLTLATLGAARVMGMDDELGSIEPGKLADLLLVDGDPATDISDIRRVVTVIKDGRVYDPAAIYRALGIEPCCEQAPRRRE